MPREIIAYCLISAMALGSMTWGSIAWRKQMRRKLRLQGIKRYGH